jgi:hypothetical protein
VDLLENVWLYPKNRRPYFAGERTPTETKKAAKICRLFSFSLMPPRERVAG